ncbi:dirigent protein 1-like [Triticum aestivum]|nr:dirigent protein 1-like [Triticum aestivum]
MARRLAFAALVPLLLMFMAFVVSLACAFGPQQSHHLHLYMHDFAAGPNVSTIRVGVAHDTGPLLGGSKLWRFGDMVVMDDALTEGPGMGSRALGRAQGFYIAASSKGSDPTLHMSFDLLLTSGPYNGSTLAVTGRDNVMAPVRELSVVGGMGRFRMATGYVLMQTVEWWHGEYALLELDVYVHA